MSPRLHAGATVALGVAVLAAALGAARVSAQGAPETFTATANVKHGGASVSAPLKVIVTRYTSEDERATLARALRDGGTEGLRKALASQKDAGSVQLGERRTPIKFAGQRPTGSGRLVTVVTAEPILFLGAGVPSAKATTGFEVAVAMLDLKEGDTGLGELAPAAKVGVSDAGAFVIEDYGPAVVWLNALTRAR